MAAADVTNLLPVWILTMPPSSEGRSLPITQISWRYLNPRLSYNYFRFGNSNGRHIGFLLPVSISTVQPQWACYSAYMCQISCKSDNQRPTFMTLYRFSRWRPLTPWIYFRFGFDDAVVFRRPNSTYNPNFVKISQSAAEL